MASFSLVPLGSDYGFAHGGYVKLIPDNIFSLFCFIFSRKRFRFFLSSDGPSFGLVRSQSRRTDQYI